MFHYRKTGDRSSPILLGLQVPPDTERELEAATEVGLFQALYGDVPGHVHDKTSWIDALIRDWLL